MKSLSSLPTWQNSDVIDMIIAALDPLEELTDLLSGEKKVTSSAIKPLLQHLMSNILIGKESDATLTHQIKSIIRQDLQSRYEDQGISIFLDICSQLDPRFKGIFTIESEVAQTVMDNLSSNVPLESENESCTWVSEQPMLKTGKF